MLTVPSEFTDSKFVWVQRLNKVDTLFDEVQDVSLRAGGLIGFVYVLGVKIFVHCPYLVSDDEERSKVSLALSAPPLSYWS